jgi:hypothetical protein
VHVAVGPGGLAERLKIALRRQHGYTLDGFIGDGLSGGGSSAASRNASTEHE